jgi:hypothetical protein
MDGMDGMGDAVVAAQPLYSVVNCRAREGKRQMSTGGAAAWRRGGMV